MEDRIISRDLDDPHYIMSAIIKRSSDILVQLVRALHRIAEGGKTISVITPITHSTTPISLYAFPSLDRLFFRPGS